MRLRIAFIVYGPLERRSGGYLYDRFLIDRLRARGHEVELVLQRWGTYAERLRQGVTFRVPDPHRYDLILEDELDHPSLLLANRVTRRRRDRPPIVALVHHLLDSESDRGVLHPLRAAVERAFLSSVDAILSTGTGTLAEVDRLCGARLSGLPRFTATPGGDRFCADATNRTVTGETLEVLFVGNVIARKGLTVLLRAVASLRDRSAKIHLTVVGSLDADPDHARDVMALAGSLGLLEGDGERCTVTFLGGSDDDALAALYRQSHVLAVPSQWEGFGIVYLEAMHAGVVPIGSQAGGAAEIIEDGISGYLVPPGDGKALEERLLRLASGPSLLTKLARGARDRAATFPGWSESMDRACDFLESVAAARVPRDGSEAAP